MPGNVVTDAAELRGLSVLTDPRPKLRWRQDTSFWYQLLDAAGGEADDGNLILEPNTQPDNGDVFWHRGAQINFSIDSGASSPVSLIAPGRAGVPFTQIRSDRVVNWVSLGPTNADWLAIGGTAIQNDFDPDEPPAYPGQHWQNITVDSAGGITVNTIFEGVDPGGAADTSSWIQIYP